MLISIGGSRSSRSSSSNAGAKGNYETNGFGEKTNELLSPLHLTLLLLLLLLLVAAAAAAAAARVRRQRRRLRLR